MNDYILMSFLFFIGVGFHVMGVVKSLKVKFPDFPPGKIWKNFFLNEWDSLCTSILVYAVLMVAVYIKAATHYTFPDWIEFVAMYVFAIAIGYAGQRLAYKYLGTIEKVLEKKSEDIRI